MSGRRVHKRIVVWLAIYGLGFLAHQPIVFHVKYNEDDATREQFGRMNQAGGLVIGMLIGLAVFLMAGNSLDATMRRPGVEWAHSVQDAAAMVRDFIKWDDLPWSLPHFAESAVRAYKLAMTPPMSPVLVVLDGGLQEDPISPEVKARLRIPKDRKSTRLNSSHIPLSRMPSSA